MTGQTYNAQEHTVTEDGDWPICAGCGAYGSHEACVRAEDHWWDARRRARAVAAPAGVSATGTVEVMTLARPLRVDPVGELQNAMTRALSPRGYQVTPGLRAAGGTIRVLAWR